MRTTANDKRETVIILDSQERKTLRKAAWLLGALAKHSEGEDEKKAAEALKPVADKWGVEPKKAEAISAKK